MNKNYHSSIPLFCHTNDLKYIKKFNEYLPYYRDNYDDLLKEGLLISKKKKYPFFVLLKKGHSFSENYSPTALLEDIYFADIKNINLLLGGIEKGARNIIPISERIFWIDSFSESNFIIIFHHLYDKILYLIKNSKSFNEIEILNNSTTNKGVLFPFISASPNNERNSFFNKERFLIMRNAYHRFKK